MHYKSIYKPTWYLNGGVRLSYSVKDEVLKCLDDLNVKYKFNVAKRGSSNVKYTFDIVANVKGEDIAINVAVGDRKYVMVELVSFLIALIDSNMKGVFITDQEADNVKKYKDTLVVVKYNKNTNMKHELSIALFQLLTGKLKM